MHQLKVKHVPKPVCQRAAVAIEKHHNKKVEEKQTNFVLKWFWPGDKLSAKERGLA